MMGSNRGGKELSLVGSNEVPSQVSRVAQISSSNTVLHSSGHSITQLSSDQYPARLLSALPHDPMSDVQGKFIQLPSNQRREFLNWMLRNLNTPEVDLVADEIRRKQPVSNVQAPVVQVPVVQANETMDKFPREQAVSTGNFAMAAQQPWKIDHISTSSTNVVQSQSEVLSGLQALPYEAGIVTTSGGTVSYVPVLAASHSTSGLSYATPIYNADLIAGGEHISYVQPVTHEPRTSQHAQVIGHISELQGQREINVVVSNSSNPSAAVSHSLQSQDSQQVLDPEGIVSVTSVMLVPSVNAEQEQIVQQVDNQDPVQPLMVIKHIGKTSTGEDLYQPEEQHEEEPKSQTCSSPKFRKKKKSKRSGRRSPCDDCKKYFHLELDESKKHRIWRERTHVCPRCEKMFRTRAHLKVHERIHTGVKPYVCGTCHKAFAQSSAAKAHFLLHSMPKPFTCHVCNKSVTTKGNLKLHMALHTGSKPYSCKYCSKTFPRKSNLEQHELVHTGEKPHSCQFCSKSFRTFTSKVTHERIHTGEKPYTCRFCGKAFSDRRNLTSHEKIHTGGFTCEACGKGFSDRRRVKSHQCKPYVAQQHLQQSQAQQQLQQPQHQQQQLSQHQQQQQPPPPQQQQQHQQPQTIQAPIQQEMQFQTLQAAAQPPQHHQLQQQHHQQQQQQQQPASQQQQLTSL